MVGNIFYHENNLIGKISNNYKGLSSEFQSLKAEKYDRYKASQLAITGIDSISINAKIELLEAYYGNADQFVDRIDDEQDIKITSQSKFRPTILEEFCGFLFKDIPEIKNLDLDFFNKKVFAGISLDKNGRPVVKTKDIGFCIGKRFDIRIEEYRESIIIPVIAIECKTYIDKTMFSESQFTAQKMKQGSPNVKVYVISEQNQIDIKEIPSKGQTPLDQIYIIRGNPTNPLNKTTIFDFFTEIKKSLENIGKEIAFMGTGQLIPDY